VSNQALLLDIPVSAIDLVRATDEMARSVANAGKAYACTCPVFTLMQGRARRDVRAALAGAHWVVPDGVPVVWALRLLGFSQTGRVYGPDLLLSLCRAGVSRGWSHYFFGGEEGVARELGEALVRRIPGLVVAGSYSPPFRGLSSEEEQAVIARVNAAGPTVVWVGLGSPKQDLWMARFRPELRAPLLVGVGAAFNFLTGRSAQAPGWMQRSGLEWLHRLAHEPRRLWRRYLIYNPLYACLVSHQILCARLWGKETRPPAGK
jgi:N-acetylglucosaminyldiphosphoundecaprenol N-acetyl-beta-D-mannosaminyltransferase